MTDAVSTDLVSRLNRNGTGIDISRLAGDLVAAEIQPRRARIDAQTDRLDVSLGGLDKLAGQMSLLSSAAAYLRQASLARMTSDNSAVTLSPSGQGAVGNASARLQVDQLASAQVLEFNGFDSADAPVGAGILRIETGRWQDDSFTAGSRPAAEITVPPGATLRQLATALNQLEGVTARVVAKGDGGFALALLGETGADQALRLTALDPSLDPFDTTTTNSDRQVQAAGDARLVMDGISLSRPNNVIDDLLPGIRVTLNAPTTGAANLRSGYDSDETRALVEGLVVELNQARGLLNELAARGTGKSGPLAGNPAAETLRRELSALTSGAFAGPGGQNVWLNDLGIETARDGTLSFNAQKFGAAFSADPSRFEVLLGGRASSRDPRIEVRLDAALPDATLSGPLRFSRDATTGAATLDGQSLTGTREVDGSWLYTARTGPHAGLSLRVPDDVTEATLDRAQGLAGRLSSMVEKLSGPEGILGRQTRMMDSERAELARKIEALDARASVLETRYRARFAAMEVAVSRLNGTAQYITALTDAWSKDK